MKRVNWKKQFDALFLEHVSEKKRLVDTENVVNRNQDRIKQLETEIKILKLSNQTLKDYNDTKTKIIDALHFGMACMTRVINDTSANCRENHTVSYLVKPKQ